MRSHLPFLVVLALTALVRFAVLFQSQTHVHSDEAIIGLMGKHILEGVYFPFYMYGQPYNAAAAWEAYLAAIPFAVLGVGVLPLKGCMVVLSLVCLVSFYKLAHSLFGRRTATLAALVLALSPTLLKWHFQVSGYSWYFLSIPVLTSLYWSVETTARPRLRAVFLLGLVSGVSLWSLELVLTLVAALWVVLAVRRRLSAKEAAVGTIGFLVGYSPSILYNLTHHFSNWKCVFLDKTNPGLGSSLVDPSTWRAVVFEEMPKFFGHDTILWYYAETPVSGYVLYAIACIAVAAALAPLLKAPSKILRALRADPQADEEFKDLLLLVLTAACFVPYLAAPLRVAGYFIGGCFFLSILTARLLERCFRASAVAPRALGAAVLLVLSLVGLGAILDVGRRNEIETLTMNSTGDAFRMTRIPGADLDAVERHLASKQASSVWATISFVYPLIFESRERLAVSAAMFGQAHRVYPDGVPWREPRRDLPSVFVIETDSPYRPVVESRSARNAGVAPLVAEYGTLTVIEERSR